MEIRDLYDENKIKTGDTIIKGDVVPQGKYYLTVVVWIQNSKGEFLLQHRVPDKNNKWATTGGHPISGETSLQGIKTEIKEELGLEIDENKLVLFKTLKTEDDFVDMYYLKMNIDLNDIIIQKEEVQNVDWFNIEQINNLINERKIFKKSY